MRLKSVADGENVNIHLLMKKNEGMTKEVSVTKLLDFWENIELDNQANLVIINNEI